MADKNMDFSRISEDEKINGIKITNVPKYIRDKAYLTDFSETLAQLAEMIIQLGVNLSLDPDEALEWARKLQQALPQSEFDSWVATLLDGGPSIFVNTLSELQAKYPNGAAGVALVRETDPARIYVWNGEVWEDFGVYQGIEVKDGTITSAKIRNKAITPRTTNFIEVSTNLFDFDNSVFGKVIDSTGVITDNIHYGFYENVDVSPQEKITTVGIGSVAVYDEKGVFFTRLGNNSSFDVQTWTIPNGGYVAKFNFRTEGEYFLNRTIQANRGDTLLPFETFYQKLKDIKVDSGALENNSIDRFKYADKSVTADKTDFIEVSTNYFKRDDVVLDKVINSAGQLVDNISYLIGHKIYCESNEQWSMRGVHSIATYDKYDNFIRRIDASDIDLFTPITPNYCAYFIANIDEYKNYWQNGIVQINKGAIKPYEPFYKKVAGDVQTKNDEFISESTNLLDLDDVEVGKLISATGEITVNSGYWLSKKMIEVTPGDVIDTVGVMYVAYLQQNGEFIQRVTSNTGEHATLTIPDNVNAIKAMGTYYNQYVANRTARINKNGLKDPEPYYKKVTATDLELSKSLYQFKEDDMFLSPIATTELYTALTVPAKSDMDTMSADELQQLFDDLYNTYPNYITRYDRGLDTSGSFNIYAYKFSASPVPTISTGKRPVLIVVSGTHGYEKTHPYILYQALKQICENWHNSSVLETLRFDVDIVVIPNTNPSGWANGSRGNINNVDISRNFEYRHVNADPPSGFTKGPAPLSEKESQIVDGVLKEYRDNAILFTSLHNFETPESTAERLIWVAAADKFSANVGEHLISKLSAKWKKTYNWLPQDDTYFGYVDRNQPLGAEGHQANLYGIKGGTFEISDIFRLEPEATYNSDILLTLGVETLINYLYLNVVYGTDYYNEFSKSKEKYNALSL